MLQPATLRDAEARGAERWRSPLDVLVVAAYGLILPPAVLAWPRHGCLNIHASLLPRWRGAAPIQRAILAGDRTTGITSCRWTRAWTPGRSSTVVDVPIAPRETAGTLTAKLAGAGAAAIVAALDAARARRARCAATPQPADGVTYAAKIGARRRGDRLDASRRSRSTGRSRASIPSPGAFTRLGRRPVKVWAAEPVAGADARRARDHRSRSAPTAIDVACGEERAAPCAPCSRRAASA